MNGVVLSEACLDLTPFMGEAPCEVLQTSLPRPGALVIIRDHQLEHDGFVEMLRRMGIVSIVINTEVSYDTDPSWVGSRLEWASLRTRVEYFALDLFCDVEASWETLLDATEDEFNVADLEHICRAFPVILSANITRDNAPALATFPGAQGILITCDELRPLLPPDRHSVPIEAAIEILRELATKHHRT